LGALFTRYTDDVEKIDLLIFITARVIKPGEMTEQDMAMVKQAVDAGQPNVTPTVGNNDEKKEEKDSSKMKVEGYSKAKKSVKGNSGHVDKK